MQKTTVGNLRCEYLVNPHGIDIVNPRLSWQIESRIRGEKQTAYQVLVARCPECLAEDSGSIWDSGKIRSGQSLNVVYSGTGLKSGGKYYWKVRIWGADGKPSAWSEPAFFSMGLLKPSDWKAGWIGFEKDVKSALKDEERKLPARHLRKEFSLGKSVKSATAYICGLGYYELYLNGKKTGDHVLDPVLTQYNKRVPYVTYDVTGMLKKGKNAAGVILGNGRFFGPRTPESPGALGGAPACTMTFGPPKLIMQIDVEYADGSACSIVSDGSWKATDEGPIRENNDFDGEVYDARLELEGWDMPGYNDKSWKKADTVQAPEGELRAQMMEPHRVVEVIRPVSLTNPKPGVYVFDIGQNIVGWCTLRIKGAKGSKVQLRFAESLTEDGMLYMENLRTAKARDIYTLKGAKNGETYTPRFTYHGFQFVELTGCKGKPAIDAISAEVVNSDVRPSGSLTCSNKLINKLVQNMKWGIQGNYRSIPTDCPQRDERQGWTGDRIIVCLGETFLFDNIALYSKWFNDIKDARKPDGVLPHVAPSYWPFYDINVTWPSCYVIGIYNMYLQFGDTKNIEEHYEPVKIWIEYLRQFITKEGIIEKDCYGDWCIPPNDLYTIYSKDETKITAPPLLATAYYHEVLMIMAKFARMLGKKADDKYFTEFAAKLKTAFNKKFYNSKLGQYVNGTQTSSLLPLAFDLVPGKDRKKLFANLVDNIVNKTNSHIGTGLIGCQWLLRVLTDNGQPGLAWTLATNDDYPSWGYMVKKGATTIWELWNGDTANPFMNSRNHVMMIGDSLVWYFERLGGIKSDPLNPGFKNIIMNPILPEGLKHVTCSHTSPYGIISSKWKIQGGKFSWNIEVPPNSTAEVHIPAKNTASVKESGKAVGGKGKLQDGRLVMKIGSGIYKFESSM